MYRETPASTAPLNDFKKDSYNVDSLSPKYVSTISFVVYESFSLESSGKFLKKMASKLRRSISFTRSIYLASSVTGSLNVP